MGCISSEQDFVTCRRCGRVMPRNAMANHLCPTISNQIKATPSQQRNASNIIMTPKPLLNQANPFIPFLKPTFPPEPNILEPALYHGEAKQFPNQFIDIKKPVDLERTLFKWTKEKTVYYPVYMRGFKPEIMRLRTFQQKLLWFRLNMEALRVSWQQGCEVLKVDRSNLVMSSKIGLQNINLRKELKIKFDDQVVDDAGGLLREWMHMFIKQIFSHETSIFQQCPTEQTAYRFVWDAALDQQFALQNIQILGVIVGKALFDRISLNCYLNRTILRQICGQNVIMHDVYSFDRDLYKAWKSIIDNEGAENLYLTFAQVKTHTNKKVQTLDLIKQGRTIEVNDKNKYQYIYEIIQLYCVRSVFKYIKVLIKGITRIIPPECLSIFEPHELQMLLNGPQVIDIKDWKQNTFYKGYKHTDQAIVWFWSIVQKYDQKKLANLLHYCTGSTRVPILGFKYLQSNRNTINKFTIEKVPVNKDNPYPRSYTCFNRLQLPEYSSLAEINQSRNNSLRVGVSCAMITRISIIFLTLYAAVLSDKNCNFNEYMENSKDLYLRYNEERLTAKTVPQVNMHKVMDNYKRSVDFFNSYGIAPKSANLHAKPLAQNNK